MEEVDIYDSDGKPLERRVQREQAHHEGLWHRTAHVWIINSRGELLLQQRSAAKESHPGLWDISSAGHISAGSNSIEAAIRECQEELGIHVQEENLCYLFSTRQNFVLHERAFVDNELCDIFLLERDIEPVALTLQKEEVSAVKLLHYTKFREELQLHPESYVPHPEEYRRLFRFLDDRGQDR